VLVVVLSAKWPALRGRRGVLQQKSDGRIAAAQRPATQATEANHHTRAVRQSGATRLRALRDDDIHHCLDWVRLSELIGFKSRCIHADSITIEERYCRGDWSQPKTDVSAEAMDLNVDFSGSENVAEASRYKKAVFSVFENGCTTRRVVDLVELVGLEPTTSSLRTMRSPN
jgi:hypothetical protein